MSVPAHFALADAVVDAVDAVEETSALFTVSHDVLSAGALFESHSHQEDQIAWAASGSIEIDVFGERWHVRREHLVWIPAGIMHRMVFPEPTELISLYVDPRLRPDGDWTAPKALRADPLAGALLVHLSEATPAPRRRARCRSLLSELLTEMPAVKDVVALPRDPRARTVAARLLEDPTDPRELDAWAAGLGISAKTLARAFVNETGSTFRRWRTDARLHVSARLLAEGMSVQDAATAVGYTSVSSFIVSFRRRFEVTPARYAASLRTR
jgi:AraC-like DNA-binding protein/quercetin dioxygenase-like cupin family protein